MKKRNKKYNPNKLVNLYRNELAKTYELWSSFDDVELTEASDRLKAAGLSQKESIEGLYEYFDGDLVVPIFLDLKKSIISVVAGNMIVEAPLEHIIIHR